MRTNCPNCGAPIEHYYNHKCPYCNTFLKNTDNEVKDLSNYDLKFQDLEIEKSSCYCGYLLRLICRAYPKFKMYAEGENIYDLFVTQDRDMLMDNRVRYYNKH